MFLACPLICLEQLHLLAIHVLHNVIRLPLLESKPKSLMRVILVIRLVLVILDLYEVAVYGRGIQRQRHNGIDGRRLRNAPERPALLVPELDQVPIVQHDLVAFVLRGVEQLGECEPLARHLVPVVRVHELVVVNAVRRVPLHPLHRRLARVQRDDIVQQPLPCRRQRE